MRIRYPDCNQWLEIALKSLPRFASMENVLDTGGLSVDRVADMICPEDEK